MSKIMNPVDEIEEKEEDSVIGSDASDNDSIIDDEIDEQDENEENDDENEDNDDDENDDDENVEELDANELFDDEDVENNDENDELMDDSDTDDTNYRKLEDYHLIEELDKLHPEIQSVNFEEVIALSRVERDNKGNIIDPLHTSLPLLTKYEKARILGARAEQLDRGGTPFVKVEPHIINGRTIATMEFEKKKIPFIIARPLPNKVIEYWRFEDLEII